jgi:hypothetical protein
MRLEILTAGEDVNISLLVFSPKDGGSMFPRNVGMYLQVYTTLQSRIPTSTYKIHRLEVMLRLYLETTDM